MLNADRFPAAVLLYLLALTACSQKAPDPNDPDILLINGKIIIMDDHGSIIEAVSIRDDKIAALGRTAKIKRFAGPETQIVDLDGQAVTPGLIDVHNHFAWGAADEVFTLKPSYPNVTGIEDEAIPEIVRRMLARLDEFDTLEIDARDELEAWSVGHPLEAMWKAQRQHILEQIEQVRKEYAKLKNRADH